MPSPLVTPPRIIGNREATRSCSVSSQTDVQSFIDGPIEIRVGRSDDECIFIFIPNFFCPFSVVMRFLVFVISHSKLHFGGNVFCLAHVFMSPLRYFVFCSSPCT